MEVLFGLMKEVVCVTWCWILIQNEYVEHFI